MMRNLAKMVLAAALGCVPGAQALAWGAEGHQAVAAIAADQLNDRARQGVLALLDGGDAKAAMVLAATWADQVRPRRPDTGPWHYVDFPLDRDAYDPRYCVADGCVVEAIPRFAAVVRDESLAKPVRAEALKFLIHFLGDVHQPLHCTDNRDRGGNEVKVSVGGRDTNLHAVWDSGVIRDVLRPASGVGLGDGITASTPAASFAGWRNGDAVAWATESHQVGQKVAYGSLSGSGGTGVSPIVLPASYESDAAPVVTEQLAKAGARLAWILNGSF